MFPAIHLAENNLSAQYTIGLDYGTDSVRALIVNTANGKEVGKSVWGHETGTQGVVLSRDPNLARQHPADYIKGAEVTIRKVLAAAKNNVRVFKPNATARAIYRELYALYKKLHDAFGTKDGSGNLHDVMKELLAIRSRVRK
jgi:ribulose kinase